MLARLRKCENARATGSASSTGICSSSRVSVAKSASLPPARLLRQRAHALDRSEDRLALLARSVSPSSSPSSRTSSRSALGSSWRTGSSLTAGSGLGQSGCSARLQSRRYAQVGRTTTCSAATVTVTAPVRICDCGGWTDTWFAGRGAVLHIAIAPGVTRAVDRRRRRVPHPTVDVHAGELRRDATPFTPARPPGRHPIIEAAVAGSRPRRLALTSTCRPTCRPGRRRARPPPSPWRVIAALDALDGRAADGRRPGACGASARDRAARPAIGDAGSDRGRARRHQLRRDRRRTRTRSSRRCTIRQDDRVPPRRTACRRLPGARASIVGRARDVIAGLAGGSDRTRWTRCARAAVAARDALLAGDLERFGARARRNVEAQAELHPVARQRGPRAVGELAARRRGARAGRSTAPAATAASVAILLGDDTARSARRVCDRAAASYHRHARLIPVRLAARGAAADQAGLTTSGTIRRLRRPAAPCAQSAARFGLGAARADTRSLRCFDVLPAPLMLALALALPVRAQQPQPEQPKKPRTRPTRSPEPAAAEPADSEESPVYKEQVVVTRVEDRAGAGQRAGHGQPDHQRRPSLNNAAPRATRTCSARCRA